MLSLAWCRRMAWVVAGSIASVSGVPGIAQQAQSPVASNAQPETERPRTESMANARPRIGIALEGGGALGFAHIGVLEWLEAHHIPVDYVAGTSMGGLVGGLYASGMSIDEIKQFVREIHWSAVLSGQVPFEALSYRRKEDKVAFPNRLEFGLKNGLSLPSGLNSGAAVGLLFDRELLPYYDLKNFDDLPIPFRCVATEITKGQKHVFSDGSLSQAMRATMSIPGVFAPVHHGNEVYSDGMAVDNLPVDVARSMGSDVVIASYLNSGLPDPKTMGSLLGIAGRNVSIMVAANETASLKSADIVVSSDVAKYATLEFSRSEEIIPIGEKAAEEQASKLEKYALNDADWAEYMKRRQERRRTKVPVPQFVEVYGISGQEEHQVEHAFHEYVGKPIDTDKLETSIADLQGTGLFSTINYTITEHNGRPGLFVRVREKDYGPPFLNFGLTILGNDSNNVQMGLGGRVTFFNLTGPGSELRVTGLIGQTAELVGELYKPFRTNSHFFMAPHAYLYQTTNAYYEGSDQLEQYKERRNGIGFDVGYLFDQRAELRVGEDYQWYNEHRTIGTPAESEFSITPLVTSVRFQYLGQNDVVVPTRGSVVRAGYSYFTSQPFASGGYSQSSGALEQFFPVRTNGILFGGLQGGTSFGADNLGLAGFNLGGPLRLSAYGQNELLGTDFVLGQAGYLYRLLRLNPVFADSIYAGGLYEIGKMYGGNAETPSLPNDVAGVVVIKTLIGPVYGGLSIGDSDHRKWFFGVGRIF